MKASGKLILSSVLVFALPVLAHAHPGHDGHDLTWSFGTGFSHPFSGWDHLLAMVGVGVWAARLSGRARWLVPASFVSMMIVGAILAGNGLVLPCLEETIAASLLVLGLLIVFAVRLPLVAGMGIVGLFALFHGSAHGAEMPATGNGVLFGAGFVAATTLLHLAGLGLGFALHSKPWTLGSSVDSSRTPDCVPSLAGPRG